MAPDPALLKWPRLSSETFRPDIGVPMKPVERWVERVSATLRPERVVWCDGGDAENERLVEGMLADGTLQALDPRSVPGCYLHRSHPSDVARTEHLTFIASRTREAAGPTNNWMSPDEARQRVWPLFDGAMKGRTMHVVPYVMGPPGSPFSRVGVEVTDSPYVVANMRIMTRMGRVALDQLGGGEDFVPGVHSLGDLSPERQQLTQGAGQALSRGQSLVRRSGPRHLLFAGCPMPGISCGCRLMAVFAKSRHFVSMGRSAFPLPSQDLSPGSKHKTQTFF